MPTSPVLPRIEISKVSEYAYQIIRDKIDSKELPPGVRLDLSEMQRQLGISRTPLREALTRLELEGLVYIASRSGTYVTDPSAEEIAESFDVRSALEVYAVKLVVQRATEADLASLRALVSELGELTRCEDRISIYARYLAVDHEFHCRLVALADNQRLRAALERENLHAQMARVRYRRPERELDVAQVEHERIMTALEARDTAAARAEMEAHLEQASDRCSTTYRRGQSPLARIHCICRRTRILHRTTDYGSANVSFWPQGLLLAP